MLNPKLVQVLQGRTTDESDAEFLSRIATVASQGILTPDAIEGSIADISNGIDVTIPVDVTSPVVTEETINSMVQKHNAEIERMKAINRKIIEGVVALIATGATAATGGGVLALIPIATALLSYLQSTKEA